MPDEQLKRILAYSRDLLRPSARACWSTIPATFTPVNVDYGEAIVPSGATMGPITVSTMNGSFAASVSITSTPVV